MAAEGRFLVWSDTLSAISDHLWLGSGFGTFDEIFPLYRLGNRRILLWDNAHNGYLELALGLGLPATLFIITALLLLAWRCLKGAFERQRNSIFNIVAVAAILLVAVHAAFDFPSACRSRRWLWSLPCSWVSVSPNPIARQRDNPRRCPGFSGS